MTELFRDLDGGPLCPDGSVVCIGAFDGLHIGHRALVGRAVARARDLGVPAVALSFEPLPREFFAGGSPPPRLQLPRMKLRGFAALGVDRVGLLRFNAALASLSPEEFVQRLLVARLQAREVWVGPDFRFGRARAGNLAVLQRMGDELADWGSYYATGPQVMVGDILAGHRRLQALGVYRRLGYQARHELHEELAHVACG